MQTEGHTTRGRWNRDAVSAGTDHTCTEPGGQVTGVWEVCQTELALGLAIPGEMGRGHEINEKLRD